MGREEQTTDCTAIGLHSGLLWTVVCVRNQSESATSHMATQGQFMVG